MPESGTWLPFRNQHCVGAPSRQGDTRDKRILEAAEAEEEEEDEEYEEDEEDQPVPFVFALLWFLFAWKIPGTWNRKTMN